MIDAIRVHCPYCGEHFETHADCSAGLDVDAGAGVQGRAQEYIEDCQVCCRPIMFRIYTDESEPTPRRDDAAGR